MAKRLSPIFHWKLGSRWLPNANEIDTNKHEMYMANARNLRLGPNATYIPLICGGVLRWVMQILKFALGLMQFFCVFRYQHVGISNAKLWRWGSKPTPVPNANGFASQWNIGLNHMNANTKNSNFSVNCNNGLIVFHYLRNQIKA